MKTSKEMRKVESRPTSWQGGVLLACKRCQKRLRKQRHPPPFAKLRKWLKKHRSEAENKPPLHLIDVPCLKICPKSAIVVMNQAQFASTPAQFSIIGDTTQMERYCQAAQLPPK